MGIKEDGEIGEKAAAIDFKARGYRIWKPDGFTELNGNGFLFEAKYQAKYRYPPFDGHGLPPDQVDDYMNKYKRYGIRTLFTVLDKEDGYRYEQFLDILESGNPYTTAGSEVRRIYPLKDFIKLKSEWANDRP